jgi:hypothetical protein
MINPTFIESDKVLSQTSERVGVTSLQNNTLSAKN